MLIRFEEPYEHTSVKTVPTPPVTIIAGKFNPRSFLKKWLTCARTRVRIAFLDNEDVAKAEDAANTCLNRRGESYKILLDKAFS